MKGQITVAIVDDHLMLAEMFALMVSRESDMELSGTAQSVAEAISLVERKRPDVVLMDYRLPDGDGIAAVDVILERWPETRVLMLSGDAPQDLMARAIESGCVGLLAKNRPMEELLGAIRSAARGELVFRLDEMNTLLHHLRTSTNPDAEFLTQRELEVLQLLAHGFSTEKIAADLFISVHTVRNHVSKILAKLGAHSKLEAVAIATRDKIVTFG
jgi:DNA-binding NarL/FixJ family response regulator